jgi:uncharacterized protein YicC (UPF0701 family)
MTETLLLPAPPEPLLLPEISTATAEQIEKAKEIILQAAEKVVKAFKEIARQIVEALTPVIEWTVKAIRRILDAIARGLVPKKWWHLYKHAKKRRVRKKYEKRIRERVLAILGEGEA